MRAAVFVAMAGLAVGCATTTPPKVSAADAFGGTPSVAVDEPSPTRPPPSKRALDAWANAFPRAFECAFGAKGLIGQEGRSIAWAHAKACAGRNDFGMLSWLLDNWIPELKSKPEAAGILAQVIANRGGSVPADIRLLQQKRLPIFELNAALAQPDALKGRYLLFVGRIQQFKTNKGRHEMVVAEYARGSAEGFALVGTVSNWTHQGSGTANVGGVAGSYSGSGSGTHSVSEARVTTTFEETGQIVFTRLTGVDPFLSVDRSFLFLVRFDGTRQVDEENAAEEVEHHTVALVSLVSYHEVNIGGTLSQ